MSTTDLYGLESPELEFLKSLSPLHSVMYLHRCVFLENIAEQFKKRSTQRKSPAMIEKLGKKLIVAVSYKNDLDSV